MDALVTASPRGGAALICCTRAAPLLEMLMGPMGSRVPPTARDRDPVMGPAAAPGTRVASNMVVTLDTPRVARTQDRAGSAAARQVGRGFTAERCGGQGVRRRAREDRRRTWCE